MSAPNLGTVATSLSGFLKATAGALSTAAINLASDITGILPVGNGGTGTSTAPTYGKVLVGNALGGYDLLATSSLGITGGGGATWGSITGTLSSQTDLQNALDSKLSLVTWYATTTDALAQGSINKYYADYRVASVIAGTTTDALAEGATHLYYLDSRARGALSALFPILYNTGTGQFSLGFGTTSANAWSSLQTFSGGASTTNITASGTIYSGTASTTKLIVSGSATSTFNGGIQTSAVNATGNATSTFKNGINLAAGCFSIRGTCIFTDTGAPGPDIAEKYGTEEPVSRGEIVALGTTTSSRDFEVSNPGPGESTSTLFTITTANVRKATFHTRDRIIGAVPTAPSVIGDDVISPSDHPQYVALVGHVPIKMTLDDGDIAVGDPITVSSSTPGYGMKAVTSGRILGWALEAFTATATSSDGMIEVYVKPQDWIAPRDFDALISLSQFVSITTNEETPTTSFVDALLHNILARVRAWLSDASNGIGDLFAKSIYSDKVKTGELCIGNTCIDEEHLAVLLERAGQSSSANSSPGTASSSPPTITIAGNNPAHINIGDTYNDLGATITGPPADLNLGIKTFLNGALVSDIIIDTSLPATDTIDYIASNAAGTSTSTRTVYVEAPVSPISTATASTATSSAQ